MPSDQTISADVRALAEQLYDVLMSKIESDLLIASIPILDEWNTHVHFFPAKQAHYGVWLSTNSMARIQ